MSPAAASAPGAQRLSPVAPESLAAAGRLDLREMLLPQIRELRGELPAAERRARMEAAHATCRNLYALGRSDEALALAASALAQARLIGEPAAVRRALTACGILSADAFDIVGGLEYHLQALKVAAAEGDIVVQAGAWTNVGLALALAGSPGMAARAYQRALRTVEPVAGPTHPRYAACNNLANSLFHVGELDEGLRFAQRALDEMTPEFASRDPTGVVLLRRNLVNLTVALGRIEEAAAHVEELTRLVARTGSPRAFIAAATARAVYELAIGRDDVALTRLDQALAKARETPSGLRDTLVCVIRAEEAAGYPQRALARLQELSEHVYRFAIDRALRHVELAGLEEGLRSAERSQEQTRARLVARLEPPAAPAGWDALRRLAVSAALRFDPTGSHGTRVGALVRALALASGQPPLQALEMGLAAELHDIGMLCVPEAILHKRSTLNAVEEAAYLRHTDAGADILRDDRHPRMLLAREIAAYHHAAWDGGGHPQKVAGRHIPLAARMCAVADAYDELACGSGSRPAMRVGEALESLSRAAGTRLDPELVRLFDGVVREEIASRGIDPDAGHGLDEFHELIALLQEDRGFL